MLLYPAPPHAEKWEELGTRLVKMPLYSGSSQWQKVGEAGYEASQDAIVDVLVSQPLTERGCRLTLHVRCAASREYLVASRWSPQR